MAVTAKVAAQSAKKKPPGAVVSLSVGRRKQAQAEADALRQMVDELGTLEREIQPWRAKLARVETLRAALRAAYKTAEPWRSFRTEGQHYICLMGAAGNQSVVDRPRLFELIGAERYVEVSSVSLKELTAQCGACVLGAVVSTQPTGPRSLNIVPRVDGAG